MWDSAHSARCKVDEIEDYHMHSEFYIVDEAEAKKVNDTKKTEGGLSWEPPAAVLSSLLHGRRRAEGGERLDGDFIYPGYRFKTLDCLITNFHLPESTRYAGFSAGRQRTRVKRL